MPEFKEHEESRQKQKNEELAPYVEAAFKRKQWMEPLADADIPPYQAYGAMVAEVDLSLMPEAQRQRAMRWTKMREILAKMNTPVNSR